MTTKRSTALGIPCPWSGDENDPVPASYRAWFWLYRNSRIVRHRLGLHDRPQDSISRRCTWCGEDDQ